MAQRTDWPPSAPQKAVDLGHDPQWDPPAAMTAAKRWTCGCGHAVLDYCGNIYGSATEVFCSLGATTEPDDG